MAELELRERVERPEAEEPQPVALGQPQRLVGGRCAGVDVALTRVDDASPASAPQSGIAWSVSRASAIASS